MCWCKIFGATTDSNRYASSTSDHLRCWRLFFVCPDHTRLAHPRPHFR
ncbi:Protein of unknown function [Pyronema omphalodes CBS 100304]|uniref:Uncharacterized protein n=1 Tax=Pyronema omphalodes (strain CBS 100304) TaxID=1076935 RepID=U4L6C6_PYROM|nr:Protein of unknown function [Pyronema omphalodes CBS 100304]